MFLQEETITNLIRKIIFDVFKKIHINIEQDKIVVNKSKNLIYGDFTTNILMLLKIDKNKRKNIEKKILENIDKTIFEKIKIENNGFINFYLNYEQKLHLLQEIDKQKNNYGKFKKKNLWYNIEFVSANPTGLLHIGHARNGAYGESLSTIFETYGIKIDREYYINDCGNQINKLALSVLIRYLQLFKKDIQLPDDSYHGKEIVDIAKKLKEKYDDKFINIEFDINSKITNENDNILIGDFAKSFLLDLIDKHLKKLGVNIKIWSPESDLYKENLINKALSKLSKLIYEKDGATWLKTTILNDDKDRVLIKSDGKYTYFMPDIAYHNLKLSRGYNKIFNIWGADHKSYVDRMQIAIQMLGYKKEQMYVCIMQMISLVKGGQDFKMSKRSGNSFTLNDLVNLIGIDAARWYLVSQSLNTHITIDIAKATEKCVDNGLYYVQYAYVRIQQILNKTKIKECKFIDKLSNNLELEIINQLFYFMPTIENISNTYQVHKMCLYLHDLAQLFHSYYEKVKINDDNNKEITSQRIFLIRMIAQIIKNGLKLIGCNVVNKM